MTAREFRKQLASISYDLDHGHLSQDESLFKLKELTESLDTQSLPSQISKQDIADELEQALKRGSEDYANGYVEGLTDGFKQAITRTPHKR